MNSDANTVYPDAEYESDPLFDPEYWGDLLEITAHQSMSYDDLRFESHSNKTIFRTANFPIITELDIRYENVTQEWSAYNVDKEQLNDIIETWHEVPYVKDRYGHVWTKKFGEVSFKMSSITLTVNHAARKLKKQILDIIKCGDNFVEIENTILKICSE